MPIRKIVKEGDDCLSKVCREVTEFNPRLWMLLGDLRDTLAQAKGAGLAAPQVGILRRVAIIIDEHDGYTELINPKVTEQEGVQDGPEGCLSVPGKYGMVKRAKKITVSYQDRNGKWHIKSFEDFLARAACHEIDHLDGKLYTSLVSRYLDPEELE